jgi:group I intron endonuclease
MNIIEPNTNLWDEKNSIEPKKNCSNSPTTVPSDIISEIKMNVTENLCSDTGIKSGIYKIINKVNGKYYVGSAKDIDGRVGRWYNHKRYLKYNKHQNDYLQHAWNKYGPDSFVFIILELVPIKELKIVEQKYLDIAKSEQDKTYNLNFLATGGEISEYSRKKISVKRKEFLSNPVNRQRISESNRNRVYSDETKLKMSISNTGKVVSPETCKKISTALKGKCKGKVLSDETKHKISIANTGKVRTQDVIDRVIKSREWYKHSEETKSKMSSATLGNKRALGKKFTREELFHKLDKTIYKFKHRLTGEVFEGIRYDFMKEYDLRDSNLTAVIKRREKSIKQWVLLD